MSWWDSVKTGVGNYFKSGDGWGTILGGVMAGIGGSASAKLNEKTAAQSHEWALALAALKGSEDRRTLDFQAQLEDFATQRDKQRQRLALDTYGQFSVQNRRTPGFVNTRPVDVPTQPKWDDFNGS